MEELFEQIMQRLQQEVPELRWIDINIGQMNTENPPVDYPCALVDVGYIDWTTMGGLLQRGKAAVEIELYFIARQPTNMAAPDSMRAQGMEHFKVAKQVNKTLQGFRGDNFSPLIRMASKRPKDYYPRPIVLSYNCNIND